MPKWSGVIGYQNVTQHAPGVWSNENDVAEHPYRGDLIRKSYRLESTSDINNSIRLNNEISLIGDQYALDRNVSDASSLAGSLGSSFQGHTGTSYRCCHSGDRPMHIPDMLYQHQASLLHPGKQVADRIR